MRNTFKKKERLCSRKEIEVLFANKNKYFSHPFLIRWQLVQPNNSAPAKILIIVPKRKLRHAVDRNRTKRLIRECYRQQKHTLYTLLNNQASALNIALYYTDTKCPDYHTLYGQTDKALAKLMAELKKNRTDVQQ